MYEHVGEEEDGHGHVNEKEELVALLSDPGQAGKGEDKKARISNDARCVDAVGEKFGSKTGNAVVGQRLMDEGDHMDRREEKHEASKPLVVDLKLLMADAGQQRDEVDLGAQYIDEWHETQRHHPGPKGERWAAKAAINAVVRLHYERPDGEAKRKRTECQRRSEHW